MRFDAHAEDWDNCVYFALLALVSRSDQRRRLSTYFEKYGLVDNYFPSREPLKTLQHLLEYAL